MKCIAPGLMLAIAALAACSGSARTTAVADVPVLDGGAGDVIGRADAADVAPESAADAPPSRDVTTTVDTPAIDVVAPVDDATVDPMDAVPSSDTVLSSDIVASPDEPPPFDAGSPQDVTPRIDTGAACSVAYLGTCIARRRSDGTVSECRDYALSPAYPSPDVFAAGCPATSTTIVRAWQTTPCPQTQSLGGCRVDSRSGPGLCYSQTDWYFPPINAAAARTTCTNAGRMWIAP